MTVTKPHSGLVELHLAVLLFGGTTLFSKLIPLSALNITFLRCIIAAIVLAIIIKTTKRPLRLQRQPRLLGGLSVRDVSLPTLGNLLCFHAVIFCRHWHDCFFYVSRHDSVNRTLDQ